MVRVNGEAWVGVVGTLGGRERNGNDNEGGGLSESVTFIEVSRLRQNMTRSFQFHTQLACRKVPVFTCSAD